MLLWALVDAMEEGKGRFGQDVKRWRYGAYLNVGIANPVFHRVPVIGQYFDIAPVRMGGSGTTVKQSSQVLAPFSGCEHAGVQAISPVRLKTGYHAHGNPPPAFIQ